MRGITIFVALAALPLLAQDWARARLEKSPRHREWVTVKHDGRSVETFVVYPESKAKTPVVVVIHEIFGMTDWVQDVADQFAAAGLIAVAPDLLTGMAPNGGRTPDFPAGGVGPAIGKLDPEQITADLSAVADYGRKLPAANGTLYVAGFCWGGGQSFRFATNRPDLAAALVFYGPPPDKDAMARIKAPVYGFYGGNDARIDATIPATREQMKSLGKTYDPVTYEGAGHGFMRAGEAPDAGEANAKARTEAWARIKEILSRHSAMQPAAPEQPATAAFKNVKVLKNLSRNQLMESMQYMSAALGEGCNGCHVMKDGHLAPELDDKKTKQTARKMIEMTLAINRDHFDGHQEVGCATCHHGLERPDRFPPMEFGAAAPRTRLEKPPADVTVAQLMSRYLEQLGGKTAIGQLSSSVARGTLTRENGQTASLEVARQAPDKYSVSIATPNGSMTQVFNGTEGWFSGMGMVREADGLELDRLRRDGELFPGLDFTDQYPKARLAGIDKIGDRKVYVVAGRGENSLERLDLDAETGLLLRRTVMHRTPVGDMAEQTDYADYRTVAGVKIPFQVTREEVGARWRERYDSVRFDVPAGNARFQKPAPHALE